MKIRTVQDVASLGTIMGVWAHPDDETFLSAGLMAAASRAGQRVICVSATCGEAGTHDEEQWPHKTLGVTRTKELHQALKILGVAEHHWLGYHDGSCKDIPKPAAVRALAEIIRQCQPDTILTFGSDGLTGHDDHKTVSGWVSQAVGKVNRSIQVLHAVETLGHYSKYMIPLDMALNIYFNIDRPPLRRAGECAVYVRLPRDMVKLKIKALAVQRSQTEAMFAQFPDDFLSRAFAVEAFILA